MPRQWRIRYPGARYHVTSRGNGRERVFYSDDDRARFIEQLGEALGADDVVLYAYCLMPNHYHLLVETPRGNISRFMHRLNTSYSMYFRYKNVRPGHCFETRYHAKLAGGDDYLVRLTRYIHLNPVRIAGMARVPAEEKREKLRAYRWSSYRGYAGLGPAEEMVNYRWLRLAGGLSLAGSRRAYRKYVEGFLVERDAVLLDAMEASGYAIGDKEFREEMEDGIKGAKMRKSDNGDIVWPAPRTVSVQDVKTEVAKEFGVELSDLDFHGHRLKGVKAVALELCCQLTGKTQRDLCACFGYTSDSSVGKQRKHLAELLENNRKLSAGLAAVRGRLLRQ